MLYDQIGLFTHSIKTYNSWGFSSINKDFIHIQSEKKDLSSKLYSLEIIMESNTLCYYRTYKTFLFILVECLPIVHLIYNFFKFIAKSFKLTSVNRKMIELLFENLSEKPNKYDKYIEKIKSRKNSKNSRNSKNIYNYIKKIRMKIIL